MEAKQKGRGKFSLRRISGFIKLRNTVNERITRVALVESLLPRKTTHMGVAAV